MPMEELSYLGVDTPRYRRAIPLTTASLRRPDLSLRTNLKRTGHFESSRGPDSQDLASNSCVSRRPLQLSLDRLLHLRSTTCSGKVQNGPIAELRERVEVA